MDVRLSPEQRALQETAAQMVDRLRPHTVRDLDDHERAAKFDAAVAASGWRELRAADDDGRPWSSAVEVAIVAEQFACGLADVAFIGPVLAAELRRLGGSPAATSPETVAFTADLSAPASATEDVLLGPAVAFDAAGAQSALVLSGERDGYALATVPVHGEPSGRDLTRVTVVSTAPVESVPAQHHAIADDDLVRWTALGLAIASADLVGTMRGAIDLATAYAGARRQFGATIGSFQAVQHLLADAYVAMEGSRSIARQAAWAVDALSPDDALAAAAAAKAYCSRAALAVCETAIQVHGGIGNTWECLAHVYLRRAIASIDLFGGVGPSLTRVLAHNGIGASDGLR
jgi:alkylation response protein AidB-like acyl-CoA dehydrogenase